LAKTKEKVPSNWIERPPLVRDEKTYTWEDQWFLKSDAKASQPISVYIKNDYNSNKPKFACSLGRFAGSYCQISDWQPTKTEAREKCMEFMEQNGNRKKLNELIDTCENKSNHIMKLT